MAKKASKRIIAEAVSTQEAAVELAVSAPAISDEQAAAIANSINVEYAPPIVVSAANVKSAHKALTFERVSQRFAHMKAGCQRRFQNEYDKLASKVRSALIADAETSLAEFSKIAKFNRALADTKAERKRDMEKAAVRDIMNTVFQEWRAEMERIVVSLKGHPQENGTVVFPDGSEGRMPKGLWIDPEKRLTV